MPPPCDDKFYTFENFNIGNELEIYGKVFHLVNADTFTKNFLMKMGVRVGTPANVPADPHTQRYNTQYQIQKWTKYYTEYCTEYCTEYQYNVPVRTSTVELYCTCTVGF